MLATPDPRELYARALSQTQAIIAAVRPDQLDAATPCDEYDVRGLLSHMVGGAHRAAYVGEGGNALEIDLRQDGVGDGDWAAAFEKASIRAREAWADDAKLGNLVTVPWGTVPGRAAISGYVLETLTHGWDLGTATGQPTELDQELGGIVLSMAQRFLPEQPRGGEVPFGPVVPTAPDAGVYAQLAAWTGRAQP
ncbi:MAG: TIGR03086 family metal-binding protein [Actinocatenispora sp.]